MWAFLEQELIRGVDGGTGVFLHGDSNGKGVDDDCVDGDRARVVLGELSGVRWFLERHSDLVTMIPFFSKLNHTHWQGHHSRPKSST
jgi:hypothetical protein